MRKNWKNIMMAAVLACACISMAGCGKKGGSSSETLNQIKQNGTLKVALYGVNSKEEDEFGGQNLTVAYAEKIASLIGVSAEFTEVDSLERAASMAASGEVDMAGGHIPHMSDAQGTLETTAYDTQILYVVTNRGDYSDSVAAFAGRTLGVTERIPDSGFSEITSDGNVQVVRLGTTAPEDALASGKIDGYICSAAEAKNLMMKTGTIQVQNLNGLHEVTYVFLVKEGDNGFLSPVNQVIAGGL